MVVNFRAREINRDTRKLVRIPILIIIKKFMCFNEANELLCTEEMNECCY